MTKKTRSMIRTSWLLLASAITLSISLVPMPVISADGIDPNADKILKSMSSYLAQTKAFSMDADIGIEVVTKEGQKLQLNSFATVVMQRPNKLYMHRRGPIADAEFIFDGKTLTVHGKRNNVYAQIDAPGTIDTAIHAFEFETGIPMPGADLLFADPYAILSAGVQSSTDLGLAYVNGIECHHLAFRNEKVDWQLWVQTGDKPLPLKYVITSKWQTAAPQYEATLRDWVTDPQINPNQFTFSPPPGSTKLQTLPANELDDVTSAEGEQS